MDGQQSCISCLKRTHISNLHYNLWIMNVLCVAAHPDDEVLGVDESLARHTTNGDSVHVCPLSDGVTSGYDEGDAPTDEIEQRRERTERPCDRLSATISFCGFPHNSFDTAPSLDIVRTVESEIADQDSEVVYTHHYGDLNIDYLDTKLDALSAYERGLQEPPHSRTVETVAKNAKVWDVKNGVHPAEPFKLLREVDQ